MAIRKIRDIDGSGGVTLPKDDLRRDGMVDSNGEVLNAYVTIDRVDEGEYLVRQVDPDNL